MSRVVMTTDKDQLIMMKTDCGDDKDLDCFPPRKFKKGKKLRKRTATQPTVNRWMNSSLSTTPASSPPDSDDNTSYASTLSPAGISPQETGRNKRKNQDINNNTKRTLPDSDSKKFRNSSFFQNTTSSSSDWSDASKTKQQFPGAWQSINSSHYIFSSDEELSESETECKTSKRDFHEKGFTSVKGEKNIKQMCRSCPQRKGDKSQKSRGVWKLPSSCLISCTSCKEYSSPVLSKLKQEGGDMTCYLALDCEFVGVGPKKKSSLGRCSIVDHRGEVLFDRFVKPPEEVTDYRTPWSGLRPRHIRCGIPFIAAQEMIAAIIKDKVVIGHAVHNDFRVMGLDHPGHLIRDTAGCKLLREMADLPGNVCALRKLTFTLLGRTIQKREHCSVTDARASLDLFRLVQTQWEPILQARFDRRVIRQAAGQVKATDSADSSEKEPELNSFFDDQYWPDNLFEDSF